jgi:hypothetical protein
VEYRNRSLIVAGIGRRKALLDCLDVRGRADSRSMAKSQGIGPIRLELSRLVAGWAPFCSADRATHLIQLEHPSGRMA